MNIFGICWIILGVTAFLGSIFYAGFDSHMSHKDKEDMIEGVLLISIFWPIMLGVFLIACPFYGIYKLGELVGKIHGNK